MFPCKSPSIVWNTEVSYVTRGICNEAVLVLIFRDETRNMMVEIVAYTALECLPYDGQQQ